MLFLNKNLKGFLKILHVKYRAVSLKLLKCFKSILLSVLKSTVCPL